jgi:pimeloyl-ACP methyl ester carboxylesterase
VAKSVLLSVLQALDNMLEDKNIKRPLNLVAHGFITGQYAATWALAHPEAVTKLVLIDVPLSKEVGSTGIVCATSA